MTKICTFSVEFIEILHPHPCLRKQASPLPPAAGKADESLMKNYTDFEISELSKKQG